MKPARALFLAVAPITVAAACAQDAPSGGPAEVATPAARIDSVGVEFVVHDRLPDALPGWTLSGAPEVRIGSVAGAGAQLFGRVSGVVERSDGVIVVADGQARELRAFSPSGDHLWTAGREGEGPGEFRSIESLWLLPDDLVMAVDRERLTVFDAHGELVGQFVIPLLTPASLPDADLPERTAGRAEIRGVLENGYIAAAFFIPGPGGPDGRFRSWRYHALVTISGTARAGLGAFPAEETARHSAGEFMAIATLAMGRRTEVAAAADRLAIADQARFEIHLFTEEGERERVIRAETSPATLDRARFAAMHPDSDCPPVGCWQRNAQPDTLPLFGRMLMDPDGRIWVQEFVAEYDEDHGAWWIIDGSGEFLARIQLPPDFTPHQLGRESVLGVTRDELDVAFVERWAVIADP